MKNNLSKILITILGLFLLVKCQFTNDEENFVEVSPEAIKSIVVNLSALADTILLVQPMVINYDLEFPKEVRHIVTVLIDEQKIFETKVLSGSFELSPFQFQDGFHQLKMLVTTSSGTNSLADQLGHEGVIFEVKKVVWIDKSPPVKINITNIERVNGNLVVTWQKYPKLNFENYVLYKNVFSEDGRQLTVGELFTITDRNQTSFIDQSYIGGKAEYYLVTQTTTSTLTEYGDIYNYNSDRSKIKEFSTINNQLLVKWNKPAFYNAFQKYWLQETGNYANPYFQSSNINDTIVVIPNLGFGITTELELHTVPINAPSVGGPSTAMYSTYQEVSLGDKIKPFSAVFNNFPEHLVYNYSDGFLYVTREDEFIPYDSIELLLNGFSDERKSFGLSKNGKYLYVGSESMLVQLNPITLDIIKTTNINTIITGGQSYPYAIAVGNQNLLAIDIKTPNPNYEYGYFTSFIATLDGNTLALKDTIKSNMDISTITGNEDLSYLYENNGSRGRLFRLNNSGNEIARKDYGSQIMGECYFTATMANVYMWSKRWTIDLNTLNITQEIPISDWIYYIKIDYNRGELSGIVSSNNDYVVFDCLTLQEKYRISLYPYARSDVGSNQNHFWYVNGSLYAKRGFRIKLL